MVLEDVSALGQAGGAQVVRWAEIRRLHRAEQMPIRAIARHLGISKNTVKRALASDRPPKYERAAKGSAVDAVEPESRELLQQTPTMPATVIAERIGWEKGMTVLKERVRELRPVYLPVDPVSRTVYQPDEPAQCDLWFPPVSVPLGHGQADPPQCVSRCYRPAPSATSSTVAVHASRPKQTVRSMGIDYREYHYSA